ncbi:hypothetical protein [Deinococcus ruber]|uniref:Uncharacterized protein n=1 Tax=Deinococcus ruber TaxID=1848197 RepID=A0A918F984_9DEIO|nr:hypothetical protein [Deinococcus ruber]GGR21239.1 hypothetical protein GCM10008957_36910 [Deinococcus ruber]
MKRLVPTPEELQQRALHLYRLRTGNHEDLLTLSPLWTAVQRDGERIVFSGPGVSVLTVLTRSGDGHTVHSLEEFHSLRAEEQQLADDLKLLNDDLERRGESVRYLLFLGRIIEDTPAPSTNPSTFRPVSS